MTDFKTIIARLAEGQPLDAATARAAFETVMSGEATPAQIAAFLMGLRVRGETVEEITAGATVMRERALRVTAPADAIDIVGTGGDGIGTWNISTATAIVVAAAGVPVAKHGNRKASSLSGTADALQELGVNLDIDPATIARCIEKAGIGFMFAQAHHSAMKHVAPVRADLGIKTVFNMLGPLSNPALVKRQLLGVFAASWVEPFAEALRNLGSDSAWVVHGSDGMDEITTTGPSTVAELKNGKIRVFEVTPEEAGLRRASIEELKGGNPAENAAAIRRLFDGDAGAYRDIVLLNAAAALIVSGKASSLKEGVATAANIVDGGGAKETLAKLVAVSNGKSDG
ncbi:anthranilate phosphoribosyltransferase [Parvibaculum sp.]|jgi:anthranilate phosphoribosyltransferase|uniref:anthranilate phosphoribosyltransferase n=1 Tax=Parvibaculum sp. TaxID=2024848 RepID=UPI001B1B171D|nr:anthranilate phosphoribosyltransferase [Parvibaculum sp.]MBO6667577.1 anthranilate phosphoribosyltransferase [Parvibaculum sp.]MBO6692139.1 anthranilate phosphoribosyltransferase [Parvibaculum sp.]MBO6714129.1 anthranilate phosphoribosyltransferase [Parvibaculum sp.]